MSRQQSVTDHRGSCGRAVRYSSESVWLPRPIFGVFGSCDDDRPPPHELRLTKHTVLLRNSVGKQRRILCWWQNPLAFGISLESRWGRYRASQPVLLAFGVGHCVGLCHPGLPGWRSARWRDAAPVDAFNAAPRLPVHQRRRAVKLSVRTALFGFGPSPDVWISILPIRSDSVHRTGGQRVECKRTEMTARMSARHRELVRRRLPRLWLSFAPRHGIYPISRKRQCGPITSRSPSSTPFVSDRFIVGAQVFNHADRLRT